MKRALAAPAILVDVGGVVLRTGWELLDERTLPLQVPQSLRGPFSSGQDPAWVSWRDGRLSEHEYWQSWSTDVSKFDRSLQDPIRDFYTSTHAPERQSVLSAAVELHAAGFRVASVSNGVRRRIGIEWFQRIVGDGPLGTLFEAMEVGVRKPHKLFFEHCAKSLAVPVQDLVLIDDNPDYVAAARHLGLAALWFDVTAPAASQVSKWASDAR